MANRNINLSRLKYFLSRFSIEKSIEQLSFQNSIKRLWLTHGPELFLNKASWPWSRVFPSYCTRGNFKITQHVHCASLFLLRRRTWLNFPRSPDTSIFLFSSGWWCFYRIEKILCEIFAKILLEIRSIWSLTRRCWCSATTTRFWESGMLYATIKREFSIWPHGSLDKD